VAEVGTFILQDGIGILKIDSPPVNALGAKVRTALYEGLSKFAADDSVDAIVLICGGRTFFAGADISEFGKQVKDGPNLGKVLEEVESGTKPIVAAIHGTALGGGYELALTCHYRIAVPSAKVGLPEVKLGLIPGGGGTQRLPRLVGAAKALEIMVNGDPVPAPKALELGMIDALAGEGALLEDAVAFARKIVAEKRPLRRIRDIHDKVDADKGSTAVFDDFRQKNARSMRGFKAPENILTAVEAAVELPFDQGMKRERELFVELLNSQESAAQRYAFFAERQTTKIPDVPLTSDPVSIKSVGIIGAGTMGGGIAMNFLTAGLPVVLVETKQEALDRGLALIRKNYEMSARKGRITQDQVEQRMGLITPALDFAALADVDLVIEAVFEDMALKKEVFAKIDAVAKRGAILASNTSFLDIDEIASATSRPQDVVGLHFFSPANVMRLLEVVRGDKSSAAVIAAGMKLAKLIGKLPVLSRVGFGFIANRVMAPRNQQSEAIILEGVSPQEVDAAIYDYGFAMGPFQMRDLAGLDVTKPDPTQRTVRGELLKMGRLGQKSGGGFYDYDENRKQTPAPVVKSVIAEVAASLGIENNGPQTPDDIVARLLYPVVNEGAKVLEEGIAIRASDIDVACILGYNWPIYTGGPMFWADTVGLAKIVAKLEELERSYGPAFHPSKLLKEKAETGGTFTR
jgi:3-hydroxyacyl-CoA dehydrogenase